MHTRALEERGLSGRTILLATDNKTDSDMGHFSNRRQDKETKPEGKDGMKKEGRDPSGSHG